MLEELVIKLYEKESLLKSFSLFFVVIELFLLFIFYHNYKIEEEHLSERLFLEMKNYSFDFEDEKFSMDIVPKVPESQLYELFFDESHLYMLTPIFDDEHSSLVVTYPISNYKSLLKKIQISLLKQFILLSVISALISFAFALFSLAPLRASIKLLEEFIKDIIHDLNTPITAILINLKMMKKSEEVESIAQSANTIAMLHKNLDIYLRESHFEKEKFDLSDVIQKQVKFFKVLYDHLEWKVEIESQIIYSNPNAIDRIIYNLLSNACKYNINGGFIHIETKPNELLIHNSSHGIKNPSKVFERFYKESERGLGIGLHIVQKLCEELQISKTLYVKDKVVTVSLKFD